ncbi:MAG: hypothetical protein M9954_06160 [Cyclobacteriaceae bacterium]|nr:hypothetical protein [Cyclobacteriaceae bacterium]MCB0499685.1 hypothetical protein [Cyclobacteriaceae bacterium]MCB9239390.1 hypothetical protein [Flammeovirgaceae bacterium]MCO5271227.1 hypothetical protein [Cyclobacteriaceae bacterium]MCW5902567.1 hypothetical protein [Cyclobacteriaceae bacterium]
MTLFVTVLFWGLLVYFFAKSVLRQDREWRLVFLAGMLLKILAGIGVGLVYTYYYTSGDTFGFFEDAQVLDAAIQKNPWGYFDFLLNGDRFSEWAAGLANLQPRSLFLVKNLSLVARVSFGNYWLSSIFFSLVSFLGCWYAVKKFALHFPAGKWAAAIAFLFVPSFVFWGSGIIKESLSVGALMFLAGIAVGVACHGKSKPWEWMVAAITVLYLWNLKYYWAALFVPAATTTLLMARVIVPLAHLHHKVFEKVLWAMLFGFTILLASRIHPNFYLGRFLEVLVDNHYAYADASASGLLVHFNDLRASWGSVLLNSPWALFSGLFRPFVWEATTVFQIAVAIENLVLLILCAYNLKYFLRAWNSPAHLLLAGALAYICLLAVFLTLSTPNFGTLSRYRIGFLPFLFFILLYSPVQVVFKQGGQNKIG